jgi:hypothetical protein
MELPRRKFLHLATGTAALPAWLDAALALDYPTRPVHLIVGFPAGFTPDIIARLTAQALSERLGKQIIVDNRAGAASNIGTELVVRAPPDGYTLLGATGANAINATLYENLTFNFISDIAPVASIVRAALVMTVNLSVPAETVPQFIAYAKQDQYGFGRDRQYASRCRRAVQCDRRRRFGSRPLSRQSRPRSARWSGAACVCADTDGHRVHQSRQAACFGRDQYNARAGAAGHTDHDRVRARV